jgi:hypothetical protein
LRLIFGQRDIREQTEPRFGKHIVSLTFVLKPGVADPPAVAAFPGEPGETGETGGPGEEAVPGTDAALPGAEGMPEAPDLAAGSLTLSVGYFGGPYYEKAVFTPEDLAAMPQVEQAYTFIDLMPAVVLESARGPRLLDILAAAGIDPASVEAFHFYCTDVKDSWYVSIPKPYLLDTERYYYPRLPGLWDYDLGKAPPEAREGAVPVPVIIALADDFRRFATEPDFSDLTTSTRFRLVFGQTDVETPNASRSAKWIHTIQVMLGGTPPKEEAAGLEALEGEVGSAAGSSGAEDMASDSPGSAAAGTPAPDPAAPAAEAPAGALEARGHVYLISAEGLTGPGGVQRWRDQAMSETAAELPKIRLDNPLLIPAAWGALLLFLCGAVYRVTQFNRERG